MSSNVRPASATAASHASMVSDSGGTICRRPILDMPIPVIADRVLELLLGEHRADMLAEVLRGDLVDGLRSRLLLGRRLEHRQPDGSGFVLGLLEQDLDRLAQL